MTTTAFQYVFDKAESIGIDRKAVVAQTITRDQTLRTVSRGGKVWRFEVKLPDGIPWTELRPYIENFEQADRYTIGQVQINQPGTSWLNGYLGDSITSTGFVGTWTKGSNQLTLTTSPSTTGAFKFRTGDLIQLGTAGHVYSVVSNVAYNSNTVLLNRPILDTATGLQALLVGPAVTWNVICTELPNWTIFNRNQVSWTGSFKFMESL